jgi:hypothetical protein
VTNADLPNLRRWKALLKRLDTEQASPAAAPDAPPAPLTVISAAIHGTLLWEASFSQAKAAYQHLIGAFADYNDMRVTLPPQLISVIGERYPLAAERCVRLKTWLSDLYRRSNSLDLEHLRDLSKQEARSQLNSLHGMPTFAAAYATMTALGGHAIPVDERLLALLASEKIVDAETSCEMAMQHLESVTTQDDLPSVYRAMRNWSDDEGVTPKRSESDPFRSTILISPVETARPSSTAAKAAVPKPKTKATVAKRKNRPKAQ